MQHKRNPEAAPHSKQLANRETWISSRSRAVDISNSKMEKFPPGADQSAFREAGG